MNLEEETKFLMKKYKISANKNLGQNFLINEQVIQSILEASQVSENDIVVEIGPGLGTLTQKLLENAKKVIAIELDTNMIAILKDRFALYTNFKILNQDILKVNFKQLLNEQIGNSIGENDGILNEELNVKIVANLPYYITTPIITKLLEEKVKSESITVMVQKEVADRLTAIPGEKNTGAITYCVNYYSEPENIMLVPNTSFIPQPKVDSEVIKLNIRKEPAVNIKDEKTFFKIIKASFMQRRKTLINALVNSSIVEKEQIKEILRDMNLSENIRGESLTIEQFAQIANCL